MGLRFLVWFGLSFSHFTFELIDNDDSDAMIVFDNSALSESESEA